MVARPQYVVKKFSLKKINLFMVATLLVALVVPASQIHARHIIGVQGGYALQKFGSDTQESTLSGTTTTLSTKRSDYTATGLKRKDLHGGFFEFNYNYAIDFGKVVYLGFGPYIQLAGVKAINAKAGSYTTSMFALGPEFVLGFNVITWLDITLRNGVGFVFSINPGENRSKLGVNWRVIPGFTFKFNKLGVFIEAGYVGNWLTKEYRSFSTMATVKETTIFHGTQIGLGVKFYM